MWLHSILFLSFHSHLIQKQKPNKQPKCSSTWEYTQIVVWPHNGILLSNEKEWVTDTGIRVDIKSRNLSIRNQTWKDRNYSIWFHLYETLENSNLYWWKVKCGCLELELEREIKCGGGRGSFKGWWKCSESWLWYWLLLSKLVTGYFWVHGIYYTRLISPSDWCKRSIDASSRAPVAHSGSLWLARPGRWLRCMAIHLRKPWPIPDPAPGL